MEIRLCAFADEASPQLSEQIAALNRHHIPYLEIRGVNGKNVSKCTPEEAAEWKKELDAGGIRVWSIGSPIGKVDINAPFEEHLALAENLFRIANVLDCDKVRMFSFYKTTEGDLDRICANLTALCELAARYGITLYHENEKGIWGDTADKCVAVLDRVPALRAVFDPANFVQCHQDIPEALALLQARTDYYHIKDALAEDGSIVPAGMGDGHLEEMLAGIAHDTVLTLEPHLKVFDGYGGIDDSELKNKYVYKTSEESFAAAVDALKALLIKLNYQEENRTWKK
jgi:sugar phosphate isomerase/epimerase